jgi:Secretion system C-terminal sorting domain
VNEHKPQNLSLKDKTMKKLFVSIIILTLATGESHAQWKGFTDILNPASLYAVDSMLFADVSQSHLYRYDSTSSDIWIQSDVGLDAGPNNVVTAMGYIGRYFCAGTNNGGFYRSSDSGKHWTDTGYLSLPGSFFSGFIAIDSMLIGATGGIYRSFDSGAHWIESDSGMTNRQMGALVQLGTMLFAATNGGIFRSIDSGHHWITTNFPTGGVLGLAVIGTDIFAANSDGGVYRSTDGGGHWTECDNGLYPNPLSSIVTDGKHLFAGTATLPTVPNGIPIGGNGVFLLNDSENRWDTVNAGLPYLTITSLTIFDKNLIADIYDDLDEFGQLYIRPISEMVKKDTTSGIVDQPSPADSISIYPNPSTGMVTIFGSFPIHGVSIENILGSDVLDVPNGSGSQVAFDLSKFPSGTYFIRIRTEDGNMLRKIVKE